MRVRRLCGVALGALVLMGAAGARADDAAADGKKLFMTKTCIACHGKDGAKAILKYPNLAGQDAKYLAAQIRDIKSGARVAAKGDDGNPRTKGMADVLHLVDDAQIDAISTWLASMPAPAPAAAENAERVAQGADLYKKNGCTSCHGPDGKKPLATYPTLAGMKKDYMVLQLKDIRDGVRTNGKVKLMVSFAKKLNDEQVELISEYLATVAH
jgi:cbb3-type cytochrome c oxidase subunit III